MENDNLKEDITKPNKDAPLKVGGAIVLNIFEEDIAYLINTRDFIRDKWGLGQSRLPTEPSDPEDDEAGVAG